MKKVLLSVAACLVLAGTMNAANAVKSIETKLLEVTVSECLWSVIVYTPGGTEITRKEHKGTEGGVDCLTLASNQIKAYEAKYPNAIVKYIAGGTDTPK
ncbi:hypothetical protein [Flavobacterium cerinum]|uniref:Uncharacterized protein n=1 Tax=Flavobacterium cerinum TaxID=2502784 RepID=A0A3S3RCV6_9FLAO|nr:hypothetical protein [Flavobacterium cerinum]RWW91632.1 hypothetical protein EPI11_18725 [Flavobacterium cerinum]